MTLATFIHAMRTLIAQPPVPVESVFVGGAGRVEKEEMRHEGRGLSTTLASGYWLSFEYVQGSRAWVKAFTFLWSGGIPKKFR